MPQPIALTRLVPKSRLPPLPSIRDILNVYQVKAVKHLSQNFLMDMNLTRKIVKTAGSMHGCHVCEVGPGPGGITRAILDKGAERCVVIEKDRRFLPSLQFLSEASNGRLEIVHGDVLTQDLSRSFPEELRRGWVDGQPKIHLIGNLPFNIASPLIIKLLEAMSERSNAFSYGRVPLTLTFQKEVAQRIVAPVMGGQRCRLSVMCQNWADVKHRFTITGKAFVPSPDVDVGVVTFLPRKEPLIKLPFKVVEKVCRHLFHFRRKYCIRGIETLFPPEMEKELAQEVFQRSRVNPQVPCTLLSIQEINDMALVYEEICRRIPGLYHYFYRKPVAMEKLSQLDYPFPPIYRFADEYAEYHRLGGGKPLDEVGERFFGQWDEPWKLYRNDRNDGSDKDDGLIDKPPVNQ